jgi:protoheme IX farnesyltransferase
MIQCRLIMSKNSVFRNYYSLTKPGVLYGNALTGAAGFLLAAHGSVNVWLFIATLAGMTLIIASACVINNYLDRDIDKLMARTKNRATANGSVNARNVVIFGIVLGVVGMGVLLGFTNLLVVGIGLVGFIDYVWLYGVLSKRRSVHGTLVGSISGAAPILAGYCAVTGQIDIGAIIVFAILFLWQMPEFYSIAIFRRKEYKAAGVPVITVVKGVKHTKVQILLYTAAFVIATLLLTVFGMAGQTYFVVMALCGAYWIWLGVKGLHSKDDNAWARKMFRFSLVILLLFSFIISINAYLP